MQFTGLPFDTIFTLAGIVAIGVTLLYILKLRKRRIQVPFSPLWGRVLEKNRRRNDLWRRLRGLLSWLLHILMIALLAFALADPHRADEVTSGRHILLLVDNSASMAATDVSGGADRMDLARQKAEKILDSAGPQDRVMLVAFNQHIQPLSPFVAEVSLLEAPLKQIEPVATGTNFDSALSFAADSLRGLSGAELVLISDGAGLRDDILDELEFGDDVHIRHLKVGESAGNVAITGFNVRRYVSNKLDYELFVQVRNYFEREIDADLELYADGRMVDTKPLTLEAGETLQRFYPSQAVSGERLEARVRVTSPDARDVFPLDNRAFAMLPAMQKVRVLLVTTGNLFLEGPLILNLNLDVKTLPPDQYTPEESAQYDLTIFDSFAPASEDGPGLPEAGNFVFFNPPEEGSPWELSAVEKDPLITALKTSHPLMRWISLKDLNIGEARPLRAGPGDTDVASAFGKPLIITRQDEHLNLIGVGFDIRNSDMPLRVALPVLMLNIVDYFLVDDASFIPNYTTGETWAVDLDVDVDTAQLTRPNGEQSTVPVFNKQAFFQGSEVGFYTVEAAPPPDAAGAEPSADGPVKKVIAANLSDPDESQIAPGELKIDEQPAPDSADSLIFERNELWIWAVLALILLLLVEWATYNRRITI